MANTKIIIDHTLVKNTKWYNMKVDGKDVSISVDGAPKTVALINAGVLEVEVNLVEKNGKYYAWDKQEISSNPKQGGGNKYQLTPEQQKAKQDREDHTQRMIVAQSCLASVCNFNQQKTMNFETCLEQAAKAYHWVIETSKQ